jgi:enterochelin esterase-like enzyme
VLAKTMIRTVALTVCALACASAVTAQASTEVGEPLRSPRLTALARAVAGGESKALQAFWREIAAAGTPLIEDNTASNQVREGRMLVTFIVRAAATQSDGVPSIYGEFGDTQTPYPVAAPLRHLPASDVWYRTFEMSDRARFSYHLRWPRVRDNDPEAQASYAEKDVTYELFLDPLNPKSYPSAWAEQIDSTWVEDKIVRVSYAEGPRAPREPFVAERPDVPRGRVTTVDFASVLLNNTRKITIYTPPGAELGSSDCDFLLLFDRASYLTAVPTPTILDNMLADGRIRPLVAILVGNTAKPGRNAELPPNSLLQKFLRDELLPWVRARYKFTSDPRRTVVGGSSFGGLASAYTALNHPDVFGNVLSQSGSYWWSPRWQVNSAALPDDSGWLIRQYGEKERLPVRFYMEAGTWEGSIILAPNRRFYGLLQEKGYDVHYEERVGGHDYVSWRATLSEGLQRLIGK